MNTNHTHQIRTATFTAIVAFIACASTAAPAFAGETHADGEGGSGTNSVCPYALPITALDGVNPDSSAVYRALLRSVPQTNRRGARGPTDAHGWTRARCITCSPTYPCCFDKNAPGTVPTISKPSDCQSRTAATLVSTTALNWMPR